MTAPKHLRGEQRGTEPEASASPSPSAPRSGGPPRDDDAFMEQVVRDILEQNERARTTASVSLRVKPAPSDHPPPDSEPPSDDMTERSALPPELAAHRTERSARAPAPDTHTTERSARPIAPIVHTTERSARPLDPAVHTTERSARAPAPPPAAERVRTVHVDGDGAFRTPEGVTTARAYLPAKALAPGRTEAIERETVKVTDPRKLPTMRLPRERRAEAPSAAGSPSERTPVSEGDASTRSSVPASSPAVSSRRPGVRFWIAGVVGVAVFGALLVALAARFWPSVDARPSPAPSSERDPRAP